MQKLISITAFLILWTVNLKSQQSNSLSLNYSFVQSELIRTTSLAGGGSYTNKNSYELGIRFSTSLTNRISIESGFDYFSANIEISSDFPNVTLREEVLHLITIPFLIDYAISQHYFLNSGLLLNIQSSEKSYDKQSGIGFSFGVGRRFFINEFYFSLNPKIDINTVLPFDKENNHQRLVELGLQLGIGYKF